MLLPIKVLKEYGFNTPNNVYVIAEIGLNHGGDLDIAKKMIDSAYRAGVDAVKFQTYITENRVSRQSPIFDILKKCELPFSEFEKLKEHSAQYDLDFFSTPFDNESVDFLGSINCPVYKIASFDVVNLALLQKIAQQDKPVILSVGLSNLSEIKDAYAILSKGTRKIALLHCISAYPTAIQDANLAAIYSLREAFPEAVIGQSDHTPGIQVPFYATFAGAQIIEKHYKLDESMDCVDSPVSITETQMTELVGSIRHAEKILGDGIIQLTKAQKDIEPFRRFSALSTPN